MPSPARPAPSNALHAHRTAATTGNPTSGGGTGRSRHPPTAARLCGQFAVACALVATLTAPARAYTAYVTNERDNTVSVVDLDKMKTVRTIPVGQRPRGIAITPDGKELLVCASDDDAIQTIDTQALAITGTLPSGPDPETFALNRAGTIVYVSNENDAMLTIVDVAKRRAIGQISTGVEPEGMGVSPDGSIVVNTSETTNMAHFIDAAARRLIASVLVDPRPRIAEFKHDGSEVWVSSELGGTVSVLDPGTHKITHKITFAVQGLRSDTIQPVGIRFSKDDALAFVALGPANRVAVVDTATYKPTKYLLVGQRVWQMALTPDGKALLSTNGLTNDISVIDVPSLTVTRSIPVGREPWGVVISPQ